jgi:hypothetical protein
MSDIKTSQGDPPTKVRLARIFISHDGNIGCEWDGTIPMHGDTLFLYYVKVSDETYSGNIHLGSLRKKQIENLKKFEANWLERFPIKNRNFQHLQGKNDNVKCYYIHKVEDERHSPLKEKRQGELLPNLMANGRIFQNKNDLSCWYKLEGPDDYSNDYHMFKEAYDFFDVRVIDDEEFKEEYTATTRYVPTKLDTHLLMREIGQPSRPRSRSPPRKGGGKTRRKCKVKKRRNRRRRNTMKRRKTTAKRRNGRK